MNLIHAVWTLDLHLHWRVNFLVLQEHSRPIPLFQPSVCLFADMPSASTAILWPVPKNKTRPKASHAKGRGRGGGRGGAGRARGRGASSGSSMLMDCGPGHPDAADSRPVATAMA